MYILLMEFEWDEDKQQHNQAKHGLDFIDSHALFDGRPVITWRQPHQGETRWKTTGLIGSVWVTAIWTLRGGVIRIISFRRARHEERRVYRAIHE